MVVSLLPATSRGGGFFAKLTFILGFLSSFATSERLIQSSSLASCMVDSQFTVNEFNVLYTPDNATLSYGFNGQSSIEGNVTIVLQIIAYGFTALNKVIDPCKSNFQSLCPMTAGNINLPQADQSAGQFAGQIPGIAFTIPDLDGKARIYIKQGGKNVACLEAELSNGKTVDQVAVKWTTAVIAGTGLFVSGIASGLGYSNTAAHVAANALSLFGYFQSQAMNGMVAVDLPPLARGWTQNFAWSMGIIRIRFMQNVLAWYIQATGGSPSLLFNNLEIVNVEVHKRSLELTTRAIKVLQRIPGAGLMKRASATYTSGEFVIVTGIKRMSFLAGIEITNFFMTGLGFLVAFVFFIVVGVALFKGSAEFCVRKLKIAKGSKFVEFRKGWKIILKGILYRIVLIAFPQMSILCLWELTERDSVAAIILALTFFLTISAVLGWASIKVIKIAQHSIAMHKSPAYILYSDPASLNRWGFLYVQFKASCYYWIIPLLVYTLVKGIFIAFAQDSGKVQSIALVLIEGAYLIGVSVMRPWMDRKVNVFKIFIAAINFVNAVFLMIFSGVFNGPASVSGVLGVVYFIVNTIFATVLLVLVLMASVYALVSKNPDVRYEPMRDDRASFIKSETQVQATELDALGATARGEPKLRDLDDDSDSVSGVGYAAGVPLPSSQAPSQYGGSQYAPSYYAPSTRNGAVSPVKNEYDSRQQFQPQQHSTTGFDNQSLLSAPSPRPSVNVSRSPTNGSAGQGYPDMRPGSRGRTDYRGPPDASRWQVGAGYDHHH